MAREWREIGGQSKLVPLGAGIEAVPFRLEDGTGEILVDVGSHTASNRTWGEDVSAGGLTLEFDRFRTVGEFDPGEQPPAIQDFVARHDVLDEQTCSVINAISLGRKHGTRQDREGQIRVGEEAYVLGVVEKRPDVHGTIRPENAVVRPPEEGDDVEEMILGDLPQWAIAGRARRWALCLPVGVVLLAIGLVALALGVLG